jgi:glycosidase
MPINPIGEKNRKGSLGSYYSVKDYKGINPEFGTLEDFKNLVSQAHAQGMKVIIDWVANHTSWDNQLMTDHPDWYTRDSAGKVVPPVADWTDVADLDYSNQGLRDYMTEALLFWVKEADIDGFRCDVAGMIPVEFWNKTVPELKKIKPVFMLAEWETPEMHDTAFDMTYGWNLYSMMNKIAKGEKDVNGIDSVWAKEDTLYAPDAYRMRFITNHDENSWNGTEFERLGEGVQAFSVLTFTVPGMPLIYSGQETALEKRLSFFEKDTIEWNGYSLSGFYSTLTKAKKSNEALWNGTSGGSFKRIHGKNDEKIYAFLREKGNNKVLVILNLSSSPQVADLTDDEIIGDYQDIFSGEKRSFSEYLRIPMKPWGYLVYSNKDN